MAQEEGNAHSWVLGFRCGECLGAALSPLCPPPAAEDQAGRRGQTSQAGVSAAGEGVEDRRRRPAAARANFLQGGGRWAR